MRPRRRRASLPCTRRRSRGPRERPRGAPAARSTGCSRFPRCVPRRPARAGCGRRGSGAAPVPSASPAAIGHRFRSSGPRLADVAIEVLAIDEGEDLDRVPFSAPVDEAYVGGDADPVVARKTFERDGPQRPVPPVSREQGDLVERRALHAAVPGLGGFVEIAGEERGQARGCLFRAGQRLLFRGSGRNGGGGGARPPRPRPPSPPRIPLLPPPSPPPPPRA